MKIKAEKIDVPADNPFLNCKLGREKYADILTTLIEKYKDGFVLGLNNEWGAGKTTFLEMWRQKLTIQQFDTIYFNAWESDFEQDPLVAVLSELKSLSNNKVDFGRLVKKGASLSKKVLPVILEGLANKLTGSKEIAEIVKGLGEFSAEAFESGVEDYNKRKEGIIGFKDELKNYIKLREKPVVFFVDELDRCRPDYAVKVLEVVKHFFSVPGIVFVLSIDKVQLSGSIKGYYGSAEIDTVNYFRRFIDIEYSLPAPDYKSFCEYLYSFNNFDSFFKMKGRHINADLSPDSLIFLDTSVLISETGLLPLRLIEKIFTQTRLGCLFFKFNSYVLPELFFILCYFKLTKPEFYKLLKKGNLEFSILNEELSQNMPETMDYDYIQSLIRIEALILFFYNHSLPNEKQVFLDSIITDRYTAIGPHPFSKYEAKLKSEQLIKFLFDFNRSPQLRKISLKNLLNKLDLADSFN